MTALTPLVSVEELRRAYLALADGEFTSGTRRARNRNPDGSASAWCPAAGERVVLVLGATAGAGTSTTALALATAADEARVVECCTVAASGLAAASQAELGVTPDGWAQGRRDRVLIERRTDRVHRVDDMPPPSSSTKPVTVVDCACEIDLLLASCGWLANLAHSIDDVVVATTTNAPGLRRLESAIGLLGSGRVHAVLTGTPKRWPRAIAPLLGPAGRQLFAARRLIGLPHDPTLSVRGVTTGPLPAAVLSAAATLLSQLEGPL